MIERKIYSKLLDWKRTNGFTALLVNGARRVGKTTIISEFAKREYKSYVSINFSNVSNEIKELFNDVSDLDLFFDTISIVLGVKLYERDTLFFFDEIQVYPKAREKIKFFVEDGRYDFIESGSLISIRQNVKDIVIPSEEEHLTMYPLTFDEFLNACEENDLLDHLKHSFEKKKSLNEALHKKALKLFREYLMIGGMPQAVAEYSRSKDLEKVDKVKNNILTLYKNDIMKFALGYENKVYNILDNIPSNLSKKEKKFQISSLTKDAKRRTYEDSFLWLEEALITNTCYNSSDPNIGLSLNKDTSTMKIYMMDTGLLVTLVYMDNDFFDNDLYKAIMLGRLDVNEGMIIENVVAQMLRSNGHKMFFYSKNDTLNRENHIEIDFLIRKGKKICPIEVKSGKYNKHTSLDKYIKKYSNRLDDSYVIHTKNLEFKENIIYLPIYMTMFL